jgi:hypothetical protein
VELEKKYVLRRWDIDTNKEMQRNSLVNPTGRWRISRDVFGDAVLLIEHGYLGKEEGSSYAPWTTGRKVEKTEWISEVLLYIDEVPILLEPVDYPIQECHCGKN